MIETNYANITKEKFREILKGHDWYYNYSDDHRVWRSGQSTWELINGILQFYKDDPEFDEIYNEICPWT